MVDTSRKRLRIALVVVFASLLVISIVMQLSRMFADGVRRHWGADRRVPDDAAVIIVADWTLEKDWRADFWHMAWGDLFAAQPITDIFELPGLIDSRLTELDLEKADVLVLIVHGGPGGIQIGTGAPLTSAALSKDPSVIQCLANIRDSLAEDAIIHLVACGVGAAFVTDLQRVVGGEDVTIWYYSCDVRWSWGRLEFEHTAWPEILEGK